MASSLGALLVGAVLPQVMVIAVAIAGGVAPADLSWRSGSSTTSRRCRSR